MVSKMGSADTKASMAMGSTRNPWNRILQGWAWDELGFWLRLVSVTMGSLPQAGDWAFSSYGFLASRQRSVKAGEVGFPALKPAAFLRLPGALLRALLVRLSSVLSSELSLKKLSRRPPWSFLSLGHLNFKSFHVMGWGL